MTFQAIIPVGGYAGWKFLERTREDQSQLMNKSPVLAREVKYFEEKIGSVKNAQDLIRDHTLLKVSLGAFGLSEDIPNKAFIRKVLEEGSAAEGAFANRLSDKRYFELTKAFGFDQQVPNTQKSSFAEQIVSAYQKQSFETAVGEQDQNMRLGLTVQRKLTEIASSDKSEKAKWFLVMGSPPLREVFETAFNLPKSFGTLDLDKQLEVFSEKAAKSFASPNLSQFADKEARDELIQKFLINSQIKQANQSFNAQSTALQLLQASSSRGLLGY
ncbi:MULTISPECIES: DUF1217 domain-containing protein [Halocynthiibacter]|uniref:DUF1217 domain-containing protein n=1 Tax=Halocynthiibacter halioticoli TaxID=2986804 RepID=A0AAE3J0Q1_9RHOB|nr:MULTISPECIES: DUF1217 domain-containing protein [Halocynthiibacter]MCV6823067.1 DUF1217 domain-containing protein [Halocynthiibacter halioticoli]MCW4056068.1 DUF1217 domain-containing protein [Halocynthiibacter sp. SDUM655004]